MVVKEMTLRGLKPVVSFPPSAELNPPKQKTGIQPRSSDHGLRADAKGYGRRCLRRRIKSKAILSVSKVYPYVINPYTGCQHNCSYCYARFMKRFTGHREPWGQFVDVKVNAPDLLRLEITKKKPGKVWISGVCDPYQPLEGKYKLTRRCLEILAQNNWPVIIQTKSPLILRDIEIINFSGLKVRSFLFKVYSSRTKISFSSSPKLRRSLYFGLHPQTKSLRFSACNIKKGRNFEAGFSIATADDRIRKLFEPDAPTIKDRVRALDKLHRVGIKTYVMIAPMLPGAEGLPEILAGKVDRIILDRMNYHYADWVYRKHGLEDKMTDDFFNRMGQTLSLAFAKLGINC